VVNVIRSTIDGNAGAGGGFVSNSGTVNISQSTISHNHATNPGTAGLNVGFGTVRITQSRFTGNFGGLSGGALFMGTGAIGFVTSSTFDNNGADGGGAIMLASYTSGPAPVLSVDRSLFTGNSGGVSGGSALLNVGGSVVITNTTITNNVLSLRQNDVSIET